MKILASGNETIGGMYDWAQDYSLTWGDPNRPNPKGRFWSTP